MGHRAGGVVRILAAILVGVLALLAQRPGAQADGRVALVIGNAAYQNVGALANPGRDAAAVAEMLKGLGFETTLVLDQSRERMSSALKRFARQASAADMAAVYYAGHGMEAGGQNYLVPVDAALVSDQDIEFELISLDLVLRAVAGAKRLSLVMLDACRNNPFVARMAQGGGGRAIGRGFARIEPAGNTLVAYAAKDGTIADDGNGEHSPFATALLHHLPDKGVEVGFLFRQVHDEVLVATGNRQEPFVYGSLGGEPIYLVPEAAPEAAAAAPAAGFDKEAMYWQSISNSSNPKYFEAYLQAFPNGTFAELAKLKLQQLQAAPATPAPTEPSLEIETIAATYVAKQTANVRAAPAADAKLIARLAADQAVAVSGRVKGKPWLRVSADGKAGYVSAGLLAEVDASALAAWQALTKDPDPEKVEAFLRDHPDGYFKAKADALLASLAPAQPTAAPAAPTAGSAAAKPAAPAEPQPAPAVQKPQGPPDGGLAAPDHPGWMKTSSGDCWIYDPKPVAGETVSWSGSCDAKGRGTGSGTLEWHGSDGTEHFEGTLSEGRPHGKGSYLFHNGNRYEGNFVHDNFEGYGTFTWQDGTVYAGEYRNGKPDGDGKKTFPNGNSYEGHWRDGWPDGGGRAKIDGRYYGGTWAQGCLRKNGHLDAWFRDNQSDCP